MNHGLHGLKKQINTDALNNLSLRGSDSDRSNLKNMIASPSARNDIYCVCISILVTGYWLLATSCFAQQIVSSTELIERAKELDGQEVTYQGEAIGEVMARGGHSWINLNDANNAIGVWVDNNFLGLISFTGSYKARGDLLEVRGIFNRACKMHGGDLDIHALNVIKIRDGRLVNNRLAPQKEKLAIVLSGVLLCLLILQLLNKKPGKK